MCGDLEDSCCTNRYARIRIVGRSLASKARQKGEGRHRVPRSSRVRMALEAVRTTKLWVVAKWRSSGWLGKTTVAFVVLTVIVSGAWLILVGIRMWLDRASVADARWAFATAATGLVWFGLVAGTSSPAQTFAPVAPGISPQTTAQPESWATKSTPPTSASDAADDTATSPTDFPTSSSTTASTTPAVEGTLVLDVLRTIQVAMETPDGYSRDLFPHWTDDDGDGCDTRDEVLIRDAHGSAQVDPIGCTIVAGDWESAYDGLILSDPTQVTIDHVVSLKEAWDSGARDWTTERRRQYANDLVDPWTLAAVSAQSNQSKGAADPSNWMPPDRGDWCRYLAVWVAIKARWQLTMDESEFGRVRNLLTGECLGTLMPDSRTETTPERASTTTTTIEVIDSPVQIVGLVYDAPGNDVVYNDSEYVVLNNSGSTEVSVANWTITDLAGNSITIPPGYAIAPGGALRVYTGPGDATPDRYFAGLPQAIWNNSGGDRATLRDDSGTARSVYSYTS
jgi:hypothetical protein